ncbi:HlyD family secretion protein [Haematobacter missouriensis]|uniref:Efflux transporter periplasmic adaptor subunit n=1 Tax=Haematobacter missouriensis TaxID=366616 RepID=A0A225CV37_9RHOB|nr:HlyD family secretion protein [Haematobacter missouriensis]OWJ77793.1 efflux transporter periplasmic adaptor subunit [Haematobacter missouriensis]OWJ81215.1 efflux transporter periplasmic adaptor subunit [Haematobacter missouriensis]
MKFPSVLSGRVLLTLVMVACAAVVGQQLWSYYMLAPWTRDGRIRADVVRIAPDVSGLVSEVLVRDNQEVRKGDVLLRVDPERFRIALKQAEAQVEGSLAALEFARGELERNDRLLGSKVISQSRHDELRAGFLKAQATYDAAVASRDQAALNLERSSVRAPVNGQITNFSLQPGNYATSATPVAVLVDSDSFYAAGYFEETKLARIHAGDRARIDIMGASGPLYGHVTSIAAGIEDRERSDGVGNLANVTPTFTWVRLAQRVPVRITFDTPADELELVSGSTATITVLPPGTEG